MTQNTLLEFLIELSQKPIYVSKISRTEIYAEYIRLKNKYIDNDADSVDTAELNNFYHMYLRCCGNTSIIDDLNTADTTPSDTDITEPDTDETDSVKLTEEPELETDPEPETEESEELPDPDTVS